MKYLFFLVLSIIFIIDCCLLDAQTPANDNSWNLTWEDNFSTSTVDLGKWKNPANSDWRVYFTQIYSGTCTDQSFKAFRTVNNFSFNTTDGYIRLKTKKETTPLLVTNLIDGCCCYNCSGNIWCEGASCPECSNQSKYFSYTTTPWLLSRTSFKYGFFEARVRLTSLATNQNNLGHGANFWLISFLSDPNICESEIDILEFLSHNANNSTTPHMHTINTHFQLCGIDKTTDGTQYIGQVSFDGSVFRKFAAEWTPTYIKFFRDDNLVFVSRNNPSLMKAMQVIFDVNVFTSGETPNSNTITNFDEYNYDIDYLRIYELNTAYYNTDFSSCSLSGLNHSLYKTISIGGVGCNPVIVSGEKRTLRAVDAITLNNGFHAELGSELTLETMPYHTQIRINQ